MTDQPTGGISRVPYCTKVRYGISGAPVLTDDDMDGSHAPGVGVRPTLIELVYSRPRDGKPASVSAAVTGEWMRFGQRDGGEVTTHFAGSVEGWPTWLAEEARLHDPDAVPVSSPPPDQTAACFCRTNPALTAQIGYPVWCPHCPPTAGPVPPTHWTKHVQRHHPEAGPAVPPPPADRAAVLREAAEGLLRLCDSLITEPDVTGKYLAGIERSVTELRRLAAEAQQPECTASVSGEAQQPDVCDTCDTERCETCHGCRCNKGDDNTCGYPDCPATRVKHSGPDTKFCVLCLSGEHERVDEPTPEPPAHIGGVADDCPACQAQGLHTIGHPYECPGPETRP